MFYKHFIITVSFCMLVFGLPKSIEKKVRKEVKQVFEVENSQLKAMTFPNEITATLPANFNDDNLFQIMVNSKLLGYAYVGKAPSKTDQFDYLILFDTNFIILKSKVLVYREDYGGEIGSKRWLKQFNGKTINDNVKINENIVAISGATISVNSMTHAINSVLASVNILYKKGLLQ